MIGTAEAAAIINCHVSRVRQLIGEGKIASKGKIGTNHLLEREEVERFAREHPRINYPRRRHSVSDAGNTVDGLSTP